MTDGTSGRTTWSITENEEDHEIKYSDMVAEDLDLAAKKPYSDNKKGGKK